MLILLVLTLTTTNICIINSLIFPEYSVNLSDTEEFYLMDDINENDNQILDTDAEMIKKSDIDKFNLQYNDDALNQLHRFIKQRNKKNPFNERHINKYDTELEYKKQNVFETNYVLEEPKPVWMGFVNKDDQVKYIEKRSNNTNELNIPNDNNNNKSDQVYDYKLFKEEYYHEIEETMQLNDTFNPTEEKNQMVNKLMKEISDIKKETENCTNKDAKCIVKELTSKKFQKSKARRFFKRLWNVMMTWLLLYIFIGIPLWCHKGWCCCCCQCKFCRPRDTIDEVKAFIALNPPGILRDDKNHKFKYVPTIYEEKTYKSLKNALMEI